MNLCWSLSCHTQTSVCVCVSIVLETGVRKESPASSFPLVACSDDDATLDGLEVQGIVGNDLLDLKKQRHMCMR